MRAAAIAVLFLTACGGSTPPPEAPAGDTSSLESKSSKDAPQDSASPAASAAPAADPAPAASSEPAAAPAAASGSFHPAPSVTGMVDGTSFTPKVAQVLAPMKKDGRVLLSLTEGTDCPAAGAKKDKDDATTLTMLVPWQDGYKVDLGSLKHSAKKGPGEIAFRSGGKKEASATFKPSGTVTIVSAPMNKGATGKLKIDMQSGDYMLAGDLDIQVCVAPK